MKYEVVKSNATDSGPKQAARSHFFSSTPEPLGNKRMGTVTVIEKKIICRSTLPTLVSVRLVTPLIPQGAVLYVPQ